MAFRAGQLKARFSNRRRPSARRVAVIAACFVVLGAAAVAMVRRTEAEFDAVAADLQHVEQVLRHERVEVSAAGTRRREAEATLEVARTRLRRQQDLRSDLHFQLQALQTELLEQRRELDVASNDLLSRRERLDYLNFCLVGVAKAMNEAAYNADAQAVATLEQYGPVCALARGTPAGAAEGPA